MTNQDSGADRPLAALTDDEISLLCNTLLSDLWDKQHHYPDEHDAEEIATTDSLSAKAYAEAKARRLRWALH